MLSARTFRLTLFLLAVGSVLFPEGTSIAAESGSTAARQTRTALHAEAQATAGLVDFVTPFYSIADGIEADLLVLNRVPRAVEVDLVAFSSEGETFGLGRHLLAPARSLRVPLNRSLEGAPERFREGVLRLSVLGNPLALQAWVILDRGGEKTEIPLVAVTEKSIDVWSFWSLVQESARPLPTPAFYLFNAGTLPTTYSVEIGTGLKATTSFSRDILPGEQHRFVPELSSSGKVVAQGWIRIRSSELAKLVGLGVIQGDGILTPVEMMGTNDLDTRYESTRVPFQVNVQGDVIAASPMITLFNPGEKSTGITIDLFNLASGSSLAGWIEHLGPREVRTVKVRPKAGTGNLPAEGRLRLVGEQPFLATAVSFLSSGETVDIPLIPAKKLHLNGTYPLPSLTTHEVWSTLVNLGKEEAEVVAQIFWEDGTYSFGPVTVAPGASHRLDVGQLAEEQKPDLSGRTLDPAYEQGVLFWTVVSGSTSFIARTEARPRGSRDSYGFNCLDCCWTYYDGLIVPDLVQFAPGENPAFQASHMMDTCLGIAGPHATTPDSMTVPSPFIWDAKNVDTSEGAEDFLSFDKFVTETEIDCTQLTAQIFGSGKASTCKKVHNPKCYDPAKTCTSQTKTCEECLACCQAIFDQKICEKKRRDQAQSEKNACDGNCLTDMCE